MSKEEEILNEIMEERLRGMGIQLKGKFKYGQKVAIVPVRIGMPGTPEEGTVLGPPKRDTPYPIDRIKIIKEKNKPEYIEFFSSQARGPGKEKPITFRELPGTLMVIPKPGLLVATQPLEKPKPEGKMYTYLPTTKLPSGEPIFIGPNQKLLANPAERKLLTRGYYNPEKSHVPVAGDGTIIIRAFWKYKSEKASPDPRKEIDADVFIETGFVREDFEKRGLKLGDRGYYLGKTPTTTGLPAGEYTFVCDYEGTGRFEVRIQKQKKKIEAGKNHTINFYFEVIETAGKGGDVNVRAGDVNVRTGDVNVTGGGDGTPVPPPGGYNLSVNVWPEEAGRTTPRDGEIYHYKEGSSQVVQQHANHGWVFDHWMLDGVNAGNADSLTVLMNNNHTVIAIYEKEEEETPPPPPPPPPPPVIPRPPPDSNIRMNLHVKSEPIKNVPVRMRTEVPINPLDIPNQIEELRRRMDLLPLGPERVALYNEIRHLQGGASTRIIEDGIGKTDLSIGLLGPGTYEIIIPKSIAGLVPNEPNEITKFYKWEPPIPTQETDDTVIGKVQYLVQRRARDLFIAVWLENGTQIELPLTPHGRMLVADFTITAIYAGGSATHTKRPTVWGGYQSGAGGPLRGTSAMLAKTLGGKWSDKWEAPHNVGLTAAVNAGKRQLGAYAYGEYDRIFIPLRQRWIQKRNNLLALERNSRNAERTIRRIIRQERATRGGGFGMGSRGLGASPEKIVQVAQGLLNPETGGRAVSGANQAALQAAFNTYNQWFQARENFEKDFQNDLESCSARLRKYLEDKADIVAVRVARQQKIPLHSEDQVNLEKELKGYAQELAEEFITRGNTWSRTLLRGLRIVSRETGTMREIWGNILSNIWGFIFGPWVLGSAFVLLQFFAMIAWSGGATGIPNPIWIWGPPIAMAVFLLIFNMENTQMPLDFLTHIVSGAMIGYATIMLMMAIATPQLINDQWFWSGLIWLFLAVFIGAFQVYQSGNFPPVFAISVAILAFFWLAMGPYGGYYSMVIDQVKAPLMLAWRAVQNAFEDMWLLATNPTEWYARQQLRNVRPDKPLDFPKAVEIVSFDTIPSQGVPASSDSGPVLFAAAAVINNRGGMPASGIEARIDCEKPYIENCVSIKPTVFRQTLKPGEGDVIQFTDIKTWRPTKGREAEFHAAKVTVNISYIYSTNASLTTTVMSGKEINKQFAEGKDVFKPVTAIDKGTPAAFSLNVGPQPLFAGRKSLLLVSVYTVRDDGYVTLDRNTKIKIFLPSSIGSKLSCNSACDLGAEAGGEKAECKPIEDIVIKPFEFSTTFSFLCNFESRGDVDISKTDIIRAEMTNYKFTVFKTKQLPITPPLGILRSGQTPGIGCDAAGVKDHKSEFQSKYENDIKNKLSSYGFKPEDEIKVKSYIASKLWPVSLVGEVPQKIYQAAQSVGLNSEGQMYAVKIAKAESGLVHCLDGTNNCGNADKSKVKCGDDGKSCGVFQLHQGAHPDWYTIEGAAKMGCTNGQTPYDLDCNIMVGVRHIKNLYDNNYNSPPKLYVCKAISYSGWDAVLRWYNGWPSDCSGTPNYVEKVKSQEIPSAATAPGEGPYHLTPDEVQICRSANLNTYSLDCIMKVLSEILKKPEIDNDWSKLQKDTSFAEWERCLTTPPPQKGISDYCAKKISGGYGKCDNGEGGCASDSECDPNKSGGSNNPLKCRSVSGISVKVCCYEKDSDDMCRQAYQGTIQPPSGAPVFTPNPSITSADLVEYYISGNGKTNSMSNGEKFNLQSASIGSRNGFYIIKSGDGRNFEEFTYDSSAIYHLRDTTWDKACSDGSPAYYTTLAGPYDFSAACEAAKSPDHGAVSIIDQIVQSGAGQWVPRVMEVGKDYDIPITVVAFNKNTCQCCQSQYAGAGGRTMTLVGIGSWNGFDNVARLVITDGIGKGENYYIAKGYGWVGYENRGEADPINGQPHSAYARPSDSSSGNLQLSEPCPHWTSA